MTQEIKKNVHEVFELLKDSYRYVDFRSALLRTGDNLNRILTILRFSNNTKSEISRHHEDLNLEKIKTRNFEIEHEIIHVSEWEDVLIRLYNEIYEEIEIYDIDEFRHNDSHYEKYESSFLDKFESLYNTPSMRFYYTEEEVKKQNFISFHYGIPDEDKHNAELYKILNREILSIGEDNIHNVLNGSLELDNYGSFNRFIFILFPIYIKIKDLAYSKDILTGKVSFHSIFNGSRIFFRIYSEPNYRSNTLTNSEEIIIIKDGKNTISLENDYYESTFQIDFSKYDCDPNFKIRIFWDKIPSLYLVDLEKSFGYPRYLKSLENLELNSLDIDYKQNKIESKLKYYILIDIDIVIKEVYREIVNDINIAYRKRLFDCVYILVRKLLENLIIDCLRKHYKMQNIDKFYNPNKEKFHSFSQLRKNFNDMINEQNFKGSLGYIPQVVIDYLDVFRETGNASAHSFFSIHHQILIEDNRDKLIFLLKHLVKIYNNINQKDEEHILK